MNEGKIRLICERWTSQAAGSERTYKRSNIRGALA
jgi:hypothetical protein